MEEWFASHIGTILSVCAVLTIVWGVAGRVRRGINKWDSVDAHAEAIARIEANQATMVANQDTLVNKVDGAMEIQADQGQMLEQLVEAVRPTNGDKRTISSRVDTLVHDFRHHEELDHLRFRALGVELPDG